MKLWRRPPKAEPRPPHVERRRRASRGPTRWLAPALAAVALAASLGRAGLVLGNEDEAEVKSLAAAEARAAKHAAREAAKLEAAEMKVAKRLLLESQARQAAESKAALEAHQEMQRINALEAARLVQAEDRERRKHIASELKSEKHDQRRRERRSKDEKRALRKAKIDEEAAREADAGDEATGGSDAAGVDREEERRALIGQRSGPPHVPGSAQAIERAKALLLRADAAFFDVDSTVVRTEGIDLLGKCFGIMEEISELTHRAMNGDVRFQDAMAQRLQLLADHGMRRDSLQECVKKEGKPRWSKGVRDVVELLQRQGTDVYLVSGSFKNMLHPVAEELRVPMGNVYANEILFDESGEYAGFDRSSPTSASGGKPLVLKALKRQRSYATMIMFGDGITDMDARTFGPADVFIGYGGVVDREMVRLGADWFVYSFRDVARALKPSRHRRS